MRGDFGFRNRGGDGPGRVEIDAGDFGGQRRRRLFGLADDHAIAPHHRVVLDRFGKRRRKIDHDIALSELEIHVFQPLERRLELPDPLLNRHVEGRERARGHGAGSGEAMAHLEMPDRLGQRRHRTDPMPCRRRGPRSTIRRRRSRSSLGPGTPSANLASAGNRRPAAADREIRIAQRGFLDPLRRAFVEGRLMRQRECGSRTRFRGRSGESAGLTAAWAGQPRFVAGAWPSGSALARDCGWSGVLAE